jgi:anthranilate phosphoribosyltransferase
MYVDTRISADAAPGDRPRPAPLLARLCGGESLSADQSQILFEALVAGDLAETEIAALLITLKVKGETSAELIGAARALRAAALPFERPDYLFADSCGTGGDSSGTINLSTAVAFVAAAAGLPVAKHGNRSVTSKCGSADVLERLGVRLEVDPAISRRALDEIGICFLFAPHYHPGLRHAGPVRRALKVRTVMNILGPCVNPAGPGVQLLGVADPSLLEPVAETLIGLGVGRAMVVHGAGLDEVAIHGETEAVHISDGTARRLTLTPEQAGIASAPLEALAGGGPEENAQRLKALLMGQGSPIENAAVALNAATLLMTAGLAATLAEGADLARQALASGQPYQRLKALVDITND